MLSASVTANALAAIMATTIAEHSLAFTPPFAISRFGLTQSIDKDIPTRSSFVLKAIVDEDDDDSDYFDYDVSPMWRIEQVDRVFARVTQ